MYYLLPSLLTLLLSGLVALLVCAHRRLSAVSERNAALQSDKDALTRELAAQRERHAAELEAETRRREEDLRHAADRHELELENLRGLMAKDKLHYDELKQKQEEHWQDNLKQLEERFKNLASDILSGNSAKLKDTNREQMEGILKPLREQLDKLGAAVHESNKETAGAKATLAEQLKQLMERTEHLGNEATTLSKALRGNSKVQGDWGEMVLEDLLVRSGLERDKHYTTQENFKNEADQNRRPDVVVRFPRERNIIIDSKVSLTDYVKFTETEDEAERKIHLKAHVRSVREHIKELAKQHYPAIVGGSLSHVLMFLPSEASYVAAVQEEPTLVTEAMEQNIIIVSPTNLMMALKLAYHLWQNEIRQQSIEDIFKQASALYEKFHDFHQSFTAVGKQLTSAAKSYLEARKRLSVGKNNYLRQVSRLTELGANPKKRIELDKDLDNIRELTNSAEWSELEDSLETGENAE